MSKENKETSKKEVEFGLQKVKKGSKEEQAWCKQQDARMAELEAIGNL